MFTCLLIRRPRRLRHLHRLAATGGPDTRTLLPRHPAPPHPATVPAQPKHLPPDFTPAEPTLPAQAAPDGDDDRDDRDERGVQARLQAAIDGRPHTLRPEPRHD